VQVPVETADEERPMTDTQELRSICVCVCVCGCFREEIKQFNRSFVFTLRKAFAAETCGFEAL